MGADAEGRVCFGRLAAGRDAVSIQPVNLRPTEGDRVVRALAQVRATRIAVMSLERSLVASARRSSVTWREIGEALGVTTQAAHRRFRAVDPTSRVRAVDPLKKELDELYGRSAAEKSASVEVPGTSASIEESAPAGAT